MDRKQIIWMICCIVLLALYGCTEELIPIYSGRDGAGAQVRFTAKWPSDDKPVSTRAVTGKREFVDGDVMHVSAVFTLVKSTLADGDEPTQTKYATLTLEKGEWVNKMTDKDFDMEWPWNAESAEFTAYYLKEWNGLVTKVGTSLDPVVLDRFEDKDHIVVDPDPLEAKSGLVEYGHAVELQFKHLCTRLTITDVGDESEYELRLKPTSAGERTLLNACTMVRDDKNNLNFSFVEEDSKKISAQVDVDEETGKRSVTFHLAPADYSTFTLTRRNGYSYLTISNVKELEELKNGAGNAYTVSLENLRANITPDETDDDWWDEKEPDTEKYTNFSMQGFMDAIHDCTEDYNCILPDGTKTTVLKKDPYRKEMKLMVDINFNYDETYNPIDLPDIVTFDGGGKTIMNIARPLFKTLYGTVTELNLRNAKLTHRESDPNAGQEAGHDTGWGVLARVCEGGRISNVRLISATLDIVLHNEADADNAYCVGALIGRVTSGILTRVTLVNDISVTVEAANKQAVYTACVGGVVGQCAGTLEDIDNVSTEGQPMMSVVNKCQGNGSRYTGGVVGLLASGKMNGCEVRTEVYADQAEGSWNYTGGAVGAVRSGGVITGASVAGSVMGGKATVYSTTASHSSTGGIVGYLQDSSVTGGIAFSKVAINKNYENTNNTTYYTIGGVIGFIQKGVDIIKNEGRNAFNVNDYTTSHYIVGTFAGGGNESYLKGHGNTSDGTGRFVGWEI